MVYTGSNPVIPTKDTDIEMIINESKFSKNSENGWVAPIHGWFDSSCPLMSFLVDAEHVNSHVSVTRRNRECFH